MSILPVRFVARLGCGCLRWCRHLSRQPPPPKVYQNLSGINPEGGVIGYGVNPEESQLIASVWLGMCSMSRAHGVGSVIAKCGIRSRDEHHCNYTRKAGVVLPRTLRESKHSYGECHDNQTLSEERIRTAVATCPRESLRQ